MRTSTNLNEAFRKFAQNASAASGTSWTFMAAVLLVVGWAVSGPIFNYSETWQLVINTGTTIITFLMVFLVQNTQNRDAKAMHIKLDELLNTQQKAKKKFIEVEDKSDKELKKEEKEVKKKK